MVLKLGVGVDNLKFGMSKKDVLKILGKPDRIFELDDFRDNEIVWEWNEKKLRLTFYKEENERLGYIRTMNSNLEYRGIKILNINSEVVINNIFSELKEWDKNEFDFLTSYFNEKFWLNLNCEYGNVIDVEMGVPFKDEEEYN